MRPRFKISRAGIELIESFEGLRRKAARLPDGRWTIGYGHTLSAREGAEVSLEDAEALLMFDLLPVVETVNGLVDAELTQNQFDALCAFAFNIGVEAFRGSEVLKRVNEGRTTEAAYAFDLWRKAEIAGEELVLDALIRRRAAEKALFLSPADGVVPTPSSLVRPTYDAALAGMLPKRRPAQIETPLEGEEAAVRRVGPIDEPEAADEMGAENLVAPEVVSPPAEEAPVEAPVLGIALIKPEPAAEAEAEPIVLEGTVEPAPEPEPVPEPQLQAAAEIAALDSGVIGIALVTPAPEPTPEPEPEPVPLTPAWSQAGPAFAVRTTSPWPATGTAALLDGAEMVSQPLTAPAAVSETETAATQADEPGAEAIAEVTPSPAPATAAVPAAAAMTMRLFSPYGAGGLGALPPRARLSDDARLAEIERRPASAPEPQAAVAEFASSEPEPPALGPEPAVTIETGPQDQPFTLTPPPEREEAQAGETAAPQTASVVWTPPPLDASFDEEAPLFEETWEEVRPAPRIIRHEAIQTDHGEPEAGPPVPFILLGLIGMVAFGGAVAAFLKAKDVEAAAGAFLSEPAILAWVLALIGVGCVSTSVYFLLKRLGGVTE